MTERTSVFIDGQNLFKGVNRRYGARVHPLLLGLALAGDRPLIKVRYYSGIHDREENERMHDLVSRRHQLMARTGVEVTERTLRYHWEWKIADRLPPPWSDEGADRRRAQVARHRAAREKGIDVALSLDAVAAAFTDECDVVIVVSRDRDLMEIADEINARCETSAVRVEVAYVQERADGAPLTGYEGTHIIDEDMVERCRDHFDYRSPLPPADVDRFLADLLP
ncbi:MAG: NYN domain-containing protein [Actinomycetota bacterium]